VRREDGGNGSAIVVVSQSPEVNEFEKTTLGIPFIGSANGPEAPGQYPAHPA
jgi:hypothetical protein